MHYLKLRNKNDNFIWPSFVDALASLLIVIIFILMIFVISQYYISQKLSGKDQALIQLEAKILEITNQLSIEKEMTKRLSENIFSIQSELDNKDLELLRNKSLITSLKAEINKNSDIHAKKYISDQEYFLKGHFPGNPIFPGVIIIEAFDEIYNLDSVKTRFKKIWDICSELCTHT